MITNKKTLLSLIVTSLIFTTYSIDSSKALYDTVGKTYDATRCADPEITDILVNFLNSKNDGVYIDICCGSGNYTTAIHKRGINLSGIDISEVMLEKARTKSNEIKWLNGDVLNLPFPNNTFDGALCISAIHHFSDLEKAFKEIYKVLKPNSRLVIFTSTKDQAKNSWLNHYFPFIWEKGKDVLPDENSIITTLKNAGFAKITIEPFFVKPSTKDLYLHTGKYKPEIYLDPIVRDGMTPFNMPIFETQTNKGLIELKTDIDNGTVFEIIAKYEKNIGENVFIVAEKN